MSFCDKKKQTLWLQEDIKESKMRITKWKKLVLKGYPPYDSNSAILEKADYRQWKDEGAGAGGGGSEQAEHRGLSGREMILCDTVMVDTHYAFVKTLWTYNAE